MTLEEEKDGALWEIYGEDEKDGNGDDEDNAKERRYAIDRSNERGVRAKKFELGRRLGVVKRQGEEVRDE